MTTATQPREGTEVDRRVAEAEMYVRTRFYPPLPYEYGAYAVQAVDACNEDEPHREIFVDSDLPVHPRAAKFEGEAVSIEAEDLVDALRLWHLVETDEPGMHDCEANAVECGSETRANGSFDVWSECGRCGRQFGHSVDSVL